LLNILNLLTTNSYCNDTGCSREWYIFLLFLHQKSRQVFHD
jgi:hypothetical protein